MEESLALDFDFFGGVVDVEYIRRLALWLNVDEILFILCSQLFYWDIHNTLLTLLTYEIFIQKLEHFQMHLLSRPASWYL